jgi:hypothetical protein
MVDLEGYVMARDLALHAHAAAKENRVSVASFAPHLGVSEAFLYMLLAQAHAPRTRAKAVDRLRTTGEKLAQLTGYQGEVLDRVTVTSAAVAQ